VWGDGWLLVGWRVRPLIALPALLLLNLVLLLLLLLLGSCASVLLVGSNLLVCWRPLPLPLLLLPLLPPLPVLLPPLWRLLRWLSSPCSRPCGVLPRPLLLLRLLLLLLPRPLLLLPWSFGCSLPASASTCGFVGCCSCCCSCSFCWWWEGELCACRCCGCCCRRVCDLCDVMLQLPCCCRHLQQRRQHLW
jgi:hypothetical protein